MTEIQNIPFVVAADYQDFMSYLDRFPELFTPCVGVFLNQATPESVEGLRVERLYFTEKVDTRSQVFNILWRSMILGQQADTEYVWPTLLKENWCEAQ